MGSLSAQWGDGEKSSETVGLIATIDTILYRPLVNETMGAPHLKRRMKKKVIHII